VRVLVTGAGGMLARAVVRSFESRGHPVLALSRVQLDVTDRSSVAAVMHEREPDVVVQCAAYTAVDRAESEPEAARAVNAHGAAIVAEACQRTGALFVYPSTDYVFPGARARPYRPDEETGPINAYGQSKLAGEEAARAAGRWLVVRTSWLYGAGGTNFVETMLHLAAEQRPLRVVHDQVGRPTWTGSLADSLYELVERGAEGIFHVTDGGEPTSWFGFASTIFELCGQRVELEAVPSSAFPTPARRPAYSVLDLAAAEATLGRPLPDWRESLARYLAGRSERPNATA
jgi:dTDP-4-dehydrorhamnose reductase